MVHVGERRIDGCIEPLFLLDDELARLVEGFCPFAYDESDPRGDDCLPFGHRNPDRRLAITEDGWARCADGNEYRYPPREERWPSALEPAPLPPVLSKAISG